MFAPLWTGLKIFGAYPGVRDDLLSLLMRPGEDLLRLTLRIGNRAVRRLLRKLQDLSRRIHFVTLADLGPRHGQPPANPKHPGPGPACGQLTSRHWARHESARLDVRLTHGAASPAYGRISDDGRMEWAFTGEVIEWRGPAPYLFVAMTPEESQDLKEEARGLIYWGQVPVHVTPGGTEFTTALFPKDGRYLELWVRDSEHVSQVSSRGLEPCLGDVVVDVVVDDSQCLA
jgi:hypothetical protein